MRDILGSKIIATYGKLNWSHLYSTYNIIIYIASYIYTKYHNLYAIDVLVTYVATQCIYEL